MVNTADFDELPSVAVIVDVVFEPLLIVLTENVADVFPAGIVTDPAVDASELELDKVITIPPTGATTLIVTVPVVDLPPTTLAALSFKAKIAGGFTVS